MTLFAEKRPKNHDLGRCRLKNDPKFAETRVTSKSTQNRPVIYTAIAAICATCMNINKVSKVKYWGGPAPPPPPVSMPMYNQKAALVWKIPIAKTTQVETHMATYVWLYELSQVWTITDKLHGWLPTYICIVTEATLCKGHSQTMLQRFSSWYGWEALYSSCPDLQLPVINPAGLCAMT